MSRVPWGNVRVTQGKYLLILEAFRKSQKLSLSAGSCPFAQPLSINALHILRRIRFHNYPPVYSLIKHVFLRGLILLTVFLSLD